MTNPTHVELITNIERIHPSGPEGHCISIGMFDGVHLGHQMLMTRARERAQALGARSMVLTFTDHPLRLLAPPYAPRALTDAEEKAELIRRQGVDALVMIEFTAEFAAISAEAFIEELLVKRCQARYVVCGPDFRFGHGGAGDTRLLADAARRHGFELEVLETRKHRQTPIKSTRIRQCLLEGRPEEAARLLGRPYTLSGQVVPGDQRGRTLGVPTANIEPPAGRLAPANGVYAVRVKVDDQWYGGMMNIGVRPTFGGETRTFEVHLFEYDGNLYAKRLTIAFHSLIRLERAFRSAEELVEQIRRDELECRRQLAVETG